MVRTRVTLKRAGVVLFTALLAVVCTAPVLTGNYTVTVEAANFKTQALTKSLRIMPTGPADKFS